MTREQYASKYATNATNARSITQQKQGTAHACDAGDATAKTRAEKRCLFLRCVRCVGWKPGLTVYTPTLHLVQTIITLFHYENIQYQLYTERNIARAST